MAILMTFYSLLFFLASFYGLLAMIQAQNNNVSFSVELIHRDSPHSPLYEASTTDLDRSAKAVNRSLIRFRMLNSNLPKADITLSQLGEYLIRISIGTPPVSITGTMDTGSSNIWTQCLPCKYCYKQTHPKFDTKKSKTYNPLLSHEKECDSAIKVSSLAPQQGKKKEGVCKYLIEYADNSYTRGVIARETVSMPSISGSSITFPNFIFGCGHENLGLFAPDSSGIIGLGPGKVSLISQMGPSIDGKFSYCLVPNTDRTHPSKINFGANVALSGPGVVSTPLNPTGKYLLTLEAISVDNEKIPFSSSSKAPKDNTIIDSGSYITYLPGEFYSRLEAAVKKKIKLAPIKSTPASHLKLCYITKDDLKGPIITAHFTGADLKLTPGNTFFRSEHNHLCFAFSAPSALDEAMWGVTMQYNFLVGYDIKKRSVSFKPMDCAK